MNAFARRVQPLAHDCCLTLLTSGSGTPVSHPAGRTRTVLCASTLFAKDMKKHDLAFQLIVWEYAGGD